jgi:hypothetical protein
LFAALKGASPLLAHITPDLLTGLLFLLLPAPFRPGKGARGLLLGLAGLLSLLPGRIFKLTLLSDLPPLGLQLLFFLPEGPFLGLGRFLVRRLRCWEVAFRIFRLCLRSCYKRKHGFFITQFQVLEHLTWPGTLIFFGL